MTRNEGRRRHKVRRLDVHIVAGMVQHPLIGFEHGRCLRFRGIAHQLHRLAGEGGILDHGLREIVLRRIREASAGRPPAVHEGLVERRDDGAGHAQMRIPPLEEVIVIEVHAAGVGHLPVNHHNLAVLLVEDAVEPLVQAVLDMGKGDNLCAGLDERFPVSVGNGHHPAPVIVEEANLHAFPCLLDEKVAHFPSGLVIAKTEVLNVNEGFCLPDILQKKFPLATATCNDFEGVTLVDIILHVHPIQHSGQRLESFGNGTEYVGIDHNRTNIVNMARIKKPGARHEAISGKNSIFAE